MRVVRGRGLSGTAGSRPAHRRRATAMVLLIALVLSATAALTAAGEGDGPDPVAELLGRLTGVSGQGRFHLVRFRASERAAVERLLVADVDGDAAEIAALAQGIRRTAAALPDATVFYRRFVRFSWGRYEHFDESWLLDRDANDPPPDLKGCPDSALLAASNFSLQYDRDFNTLKIENEALPIRWNAHQLTFPIAMAAGRVTSLRSLDLPVTEVPHAKTEFHYDIRPQGALTVLAADARGGRFLHSMAQFTDTHWFRTRVFYSVGSAGYEPRLLVTIRHLDEDIAEVLTWEFVGALAPVPLPLAARLRVPRNAIVVPLAMPGGRTSDAQAFVQRSRTEFGTLIECVDGFGLVVPEWQRSAPPAPRGSRLDEGAAEPRSGTMTPSVIETGLLACALGALLALVVWRVRRSRGFPVALAVGCFCWPGCGSSANGPALLTVLNPECLILDFRHQAVPPERVTITVRARNASGRSLAVERIATSCACVAAGAVARKLEPDEVFEIPLELHLTGVAGLFNQNARVIFGDGQSHELNITVYALQAERVRPAMVYLTGRPGPQTVTVSVEPSDSRTLDEPALACTEPDALAQSSWTKRSIAGRPLWEFAGRLDTRKLGPDSALRLSGTGIRTRLIPIVVAEAPAIRLWPERLWLRRSQRAGAVAVISATEALTDSEILVDPVERVRFVVERDDGVGVWWVRFELEPEYAGSQPLNVRVRTPVATLLATAWTEQ